MYYIKITSIFLLFTFSVYSQENFNLNTTETFEIVKIIAQKNNMRKMDLSKISGSPYSTETFALAKVERENEKANANLLLRYNGYNDEIEIGKSTKQETSEEALLKDKSLSATFNNKTYQYKTFTSKKDETTDGYLIVIYNGENYQLYRQDKKKLSEGRLAKTSLHKDIAPRFRDVQSFYLAEGKSLPHEIDLKIKSIRKQLRPEDILKSKKIKSEEELIAFLESLEQ